MSYAVCVTFSVKLPEHRMFMDMVSENARISLADEEGCKQFDVCADKQYPGEVFLYEIYSSPEAFKAHLETRHFKSFDKETAHMILDKQVRIYDEVI